MNYEYINNYNNEKGNINSKREEKKETINNNGNTIKRVRIKVRLKRPESD